MRAALLWLSVVASAPAAEYHTPWAAASQRTLVQNLDISFKDHDGRDGVLRTLLGKPTVITFFYTRCQNAKKCSAAVSRLGALQRTLAQADLNEAVRLLAISYEPQFDTPERLNRFATDRGVRLGEHALALQLDADRHQALLDELEAPANYNGEWINTHGVELFLLDRKGRVVRKYHTRLWDNEQVVADLQRVLAED